MSVPTLLANHSLAVEIVQLAFHSPLPWHKKPTYHTVLFADGKPVALLDIPTRNGALHIVDRLLNPARLHHPPPGAPDGPEAGVRAEGGHEDGEWAGWEEWLPRWAAEN